MYDIHSPRVQGVEEMLRLMRKALQHNLPTRVLRSLTLQTVWVAECRYQLLEALAEHIAQKLISEFSCRRVCITIEKPGALDKMARVGVRITRYAEVATTPYAFPG